MRRGHSAPSVSFFAFQDIITSVVGIFVLIALTMALQLIEQTIKSRTSNSMVTDQLSETLDFVREQTKSLENRFEVLSQRQAASANVNRLNADAIAAEIAQEIQSTENRLARSFELANELQRSLIVAEQQHHQLVQESVQLEPDRDNLKKMLDKTKAIEDQLGKLATEDPLIFRDSKIHGKSIVLVDIHRSHFRILELDKHAATTVQGRSNFQSWLTKNPRDDLHFLLLIRPDGIAAFEDCRDVIEARSASYGFDVLGQSKNLQMGSQMGVSP